MMDFLKAESFSSLLVGVSFTIFKVSTQPEIKCIYKYVGLPIPIVVVSAGVSHEQYGLNDRYYVHHTYYISY